MESQTSFNQQTSDFDGGEPRKELNQWNSLLELRFRCSVPLVFSESLVPVEALQLSEACMFARDVLCGRVRQYVHMWE